MASVHIVLATRDGAPHLRAQLRSIHWQSHTDWALILSDDGSTDDTIPIAKVAIPDQKLTVLTGPKSGLALNFWNGLMHVPTGGYAAFCDQDDIWLPNKLARALQRLAQTKGPAFYTANRWIADADLNGRIFDKRSAPSGFHYTLFRNAAAGHTCIFSPAAVQLLQRCPPPRDVPFHDWWAALLLSGAGAKWHHDPSAVLLYRQHGNNALGAVGSRFTRLLKGEYRRWVNANCAGLQTYGDRLTPHAQFSLDATLRMLRDHPNRLYLKMATTRMPFASAFRLD